MMGSLVCAILIILLVGDNYEGVVAIDSDDKESFDKHYEVMWGSNNYVLPFDHGKQVQLSLDNCSGSGFRSKMTYGSGFFELRIKLPNRDSTGVVTSYYLKSKGERHDVIDVEFLGNREGKPYTIQTNIFVDGKGDREQRIQLWFDPSQYFHTYRILWNQHQIVFFVDHVPIRVYKNNSNIQGAGYPSKAMRVVAALRTGDGVKTNWAYAPFKAYFQGFGVRACESLQNETLLSKAQAQAQAQGQPYECSSERYSWNKQIFWQLDPERQRLYEHIQKGYLTYDYCADRLRFPTAPKEC